MASKLFITKSFTSIESEHQNSQLKRALGPWQLTALGVGGTIGMAAEPPAPVVTYVERERVPSVAVQEKIVVGEPLPATVQLHTIPQYETYRFAVVNNQRVIVDPQTRKVVKIVK